MSFFFRKRTPRGPPPAHCKTCKQRLDACACAPTNEESYEERRARAPRPKTNWFGRAAPAAPEPAPADAADDGSCEDATPRLDAAADRRLESVYAAYVDDAARANAGARLQESDAPPISCFGEDAFCMAHTGRSAVSGVVDYQSMATRNRLDAGPLALTPPKKPSPGLEGRYRSLARIDTSAAPAPAARSGGLELYLESRGLGAYAPRIRALGARKVADLQLLSDEDIDDLGVPKELRVVLKVSLS